MVALSEVFVPVSPDARNFGPDLSRQLRRVDASRAGKQVAGSFGSGFKSAFGRIALTVGGLFAAQKVAGLFTDSIAEAREAGQVTRLTESIIKSTGGAAKITAGQVGDLAEALSNKTAIDDEAVQVGANLLLTFKNVRNEAGKGNDIFNQATAAALDLSAAGFGSIESASKMLGKALNDPLRGMTALSRAGVTFTDQQKEQVRVLVESGDLLGAQNIILQEVQSQVGGAAAAAADPMQRLRVIVDNLKERVGGFLLPVLERAADWLGARLPVALETAKGWFDALIGAFRDPESAGGGGFVGFLERVGAAARYVFDFFKAEVLPRLRDFADFVTGTVVPALSSLAGWLGRNKGVLAAAVGLIAALTVVTTLHGAALAVAAAGGLAQWIAQVKIVTAITKVWTAVQWALNASFAGFPVVIIIAAIAALVAAVVLAWKHSETFRDVVKGAWAAIQAAVKNAWENVIKPALAALVAFWTGTLAPALLWLWNNVAKPAFAGIAAAVKGAWAVIQVIVGALVWFWKTILGPTILWLWNNVVKPAFAGIRFVIQVALAVIRVHLAALVWFFRNVLGPIFSWLWKNIVKPIWDNIKTAIKNAWDFIKPILKALGDFIEDKVAPAFRTGVALIKAAWDGLKAAALVPINFVIRTVYLGGIKKVFDTIAKAVGSSARLPYVSPLSMNSGPKGRGMLQRAKGGPTPPGWALVGEEGPELVRFTSPGEVFTARETRRMLAGTDALVGHAAAGAGGIGDFVTGVLRWVGGKLAGAARRVLRPLVNLIPGGSLLGKIARGAASKAIGLVLDWVGRNDQPPPAAPGSAAGRGGWTLPLRPGSYRVGMPFLGYPGHYGADYPAPRGTAVYAARAGTVARALSLTTSYGRHVFLSHPGGWQTRYAHLQNYVVRAGQRVAAGQYIGRVDSTGRSTGNHLHFEVRLGGRALNPRGLVFDQGGVLEPGWNTVYNGTGGHERMVPADDAATVRLHRSDLRALGEVIAGEMIAALGAANHAATRRTDVLTRGG